ncbi:MAG: O-antigen ligase family protein [Clostridia bacterium]|nr:O-antigen ligase family protein [Clostridia bacterium]
MIKVLKQSFIYKFLSSLVSFIESFITHSGLYSLLTKEHEKKHEGFLEKFLYKIISGLRVIFEKLRLNKLFEGSLFAKTYIFVGLTIALAPILPTMLCLACVLGCIVSFFLKVMLDKEFKFRYTPVNGALIFFMIVYGLCALTSADIKSSIQVAALLLSFMAFYFVIINSVETEKQLKGLIAIFVAVGFAVAGLGIYQYLFGGSFASSSFVDKELFEDIQTRVSGTFDNPNVMGEYLLLVIPVAMSYFFNSKGFRKKIIALGVIGVMCVSLALTYSRGCYLGLIICVGIYLLLINLRFILLFLAGVVAIPFVLPKSIINRFTSIGNTEDTSTSYRISIWKGAIDMFKDYWYRPIGQGTTAFNSVYPLYSLSGVGAEHTHNLFLQVAVETGAVGIIAFLFLIFRFFQCILSAIKNVTDKINRVYLISFVSGFAGFIVQSMFDNTWYNNRVVLIFWAYIALAVSMTFAHKLRR